MADYWSSEAAKARDKARRDARDAAAKARAEESTSSGRGDFKRMVDKDYDWMGYAKNMGAR